MKRAFSLIAFSLLLSTLALAGEDWPQGGHDPARSSAVAATIPPPLEVAWEVDLGGPVEAVVIAGRTVAAVSGHEIVALESETGEERWRFQVPDVQGSFRSRPAIAGELVLVGGQLSDVLYALDLESGEVRWQLAGLENLYADPCVVGELAVVGTPAGLFVIAAASGERVWVQDVRVMGSPAAGEGLAFANVWSRELVAYSLESGAEVWRDPTAWWGSPSDPVLVADKLALVMVDRVRLWERETGRSAGEIRLPHRQPSGAPFPPAAAAGWLFVPLTDGITGWLVAVDTQAAEVKWVLALPGILRSPCIAGDVVYAASGNLLVALDRGGRGLLWQREFPGEAYAGPVAAGGAIFCGFGTTLYKLIPQRG